MHVKRHRWFFLINDCMNVYCSCFPRSQQLRGGSLAVMGQELVADGSRTTQLRLHCAFVERKESQSSPPEKAETPKPSQKPCSLLVLVILGKEHILAWWVL